MAKVTIDGISIEVPDGTTILNAARMIGGDIVPPAMCYYSKLKTSGGYCRTCIVKVTKGSEKDPRPMPKPCCFLQNNSDGRNGSSEHYIT
jgi:NADH-quinone oxidoreductase subunit G